MMYENTYRSPRSAIQALMGLGGDFYSAVRDHQGQSVLDSADPVAALAERLRSISARSGIEFDSPWHEGRIIRFRSHDCAIEIVEECAQALPDEGLLGGDVRIFYFASTKSTRVGKDRPTQYILRVCRFCEGGKIDPRFRPPGWKRID